MRNGFSFRRADFGANFFYLKQLTTLISLVLVSSCASVPQERQREAKLMPREVAMQLVVRFVTPQWAKDPVLYPSLLNHPLCSDSDKFPRHTPFEEMLVSRDFSKVIISSNSKASFWCGSGVVAVVPTASAQDADDLIDALISLGAKPAFSSK